MNRIDEELLEKGLSYKSYRARAKENGGVLDEVFAKPAYRPGELEHLHALPPLTVVALAEDWCPDVVHTLPTWARVAEELPGWSLRVFPRDEHERLMDAFLWKGKARRIPVYAFYDEARHLQTWWSGRGREAQEALDGALQGRSFHDLAEPERKKVAAVLREGYPERFRRSNFEEVYTQLLAFFHQL